MSERPNLHLVDTQTGEVVEDDRDVLIAQQAADIQGKTLTIGRLKKELAQLRGVEPESETIRGILLYCKKRIGRPRLEIAPGGKRWEKVRARLCEKLDGREPWTPYELMLAADGALLDPWISGRDRNSKGYLDPITIYRDEVIVGRLRDLALGFNDQAGIELGDLLDLTNELSVVNWRFLLRKCTCGHRRQEHAAPRSVDAHERCFFCDCDDFAEDHFDKFNQTR